MHGRLAPRTRHSAQLPHNHHTITTEVPHNHHTTTAQPPHHMACHNHHPQVIWHDSLLIGAPGMDPLPGGRSGVARLRSALLSALPDLRISVHEVQAAEAGHALLYWSMAGTHRGPLIRADGGTIEATGRDVSMNGSAVLRFHPVETGAGGCQMHTSRRLLHELAPCMNWRHLQLRFMINLNCIPSPLISPPPVMRL